MKNVLNKIMGKKVVKDDVIEDVVGCPGAKIRSNGMGRGLEIGKGKGPVGGRR